MYLNPITRITSVHVNKSVSTTVWTNREWMLGICQQEPVIQRKVAGLTSSQLGWVLVEPGESE
jgi:hypothetical protein